MYMYVYKTQAKKVKLLSFCDDLLWELCLAEDVPEALCLIGIVHLDHAVPGAHEDQVI